MRVATGCTWPYDVLVGHESGREKSLRDTRTVAKLLSPKEDSDIPVLARLGGAPTAPMSGVFGGPSGLTK